jgi:mitogen-activated protein kinase 1/3
MQDLSTKIDNLFDMNHTNNPNINSLTDTDSSDYNYSTPFSPTNPLNSLNHEVNYTHYDPANPSGSLSEPLLSHSDSLIPPSSSLSSSSSGDDSSDSDSDNSHARGKHPATNSSGTSATNTSDTHNNYSSSSSDKKLNEAELQGKYRWIRFAGSGSYGSVHICEDISTGKNVAIKKIPLAFDNLTNAKRLLREIKILRMLSHPNVIGFKGLLAPINPQSFTDLLIAFEFFETDLQKLIHSDQPFTNDHVQYFLYQILIGINYIHSAQVIHRDLKPANILVNSDCALSLCDFGLARSTQQQGAQFLGATNPNSHSSSNSTPETKQSSLISANNSAANSAENGAAILPQPKLISQRQSSSLDLNKLPLKPPEKLTRELTKHVVTRWYRAPELILLNDKYTTAIDMVKSAAIIQRPVALPLKAQFPAFTHN